MATTNTSLAAKLLPVLSYTDNSVISPYGISTVLAMVAEGASEESLNEILVALGYESLDDLRESLTTTLEAPCEAFKSKNSITLMRGEKGAELLEQFKQVLSRDYSATIAEKDSDGEATVQLQNIANFKAEWLHKMERDTSHTRLFHQADGNDSRPAFLNCAAGLRYYVDYRDIRRTVQAIALPYKYNGEGIPFELVLVDSDKQLDADRLRKIFEGMQLGKCEVEFPEFSISNEYDLIPVMKELGMKNAFAPEVEAFDRIATTTLYAGTFRQKAEIQVDKNGTVAKARTFMILCKCASVSETVKLRFYRPFYYFLRNTVSGDILFMGRVNTLSDCERTKEVFDLADFLR